MSGITLAAGRPHTAPEERKQERHGKTKQEKDVTARGLMGSLRIIELQLVAFIVVFSASGLVPLLDLLFPVFSSIYFFFLASFVFHSYQRAADPKEVFHGSRMFQLYVILGTVLGLFLPLAYVLGGFARGDQDAVRAATPHLFLLSSQVLSENIISGMSLFSPPVRVIVPVLYTGRRLFSLVNWVEITFFRSTPPAHPRFQDVAWLWFGRALSMANLIYFTINFLFFLIPRFLPRAFDRYFKQRDSYKARREESAKKQYETNKKHQ